MVEEVAHWRFWHRRLASLDPFDAPTVIVEPISVTGHGSVDPPRPDSLPATTHRRDLTRAARIGVLAGSFNPLTTAHVELARQAARHAQLDLMLLGLSVRTIDKEIVTGLALEDRLRLIEACFAAEMGAGWGIALFNRGLYLDQAIAMRRHWPTAALWFVVGFDKIVQILDPRYYDDRDLALDQLFGSAGFLVAPRGDHDLPSLDNLLAEPANRAYARGVRPLPLDPTHRAIAASDVRAAIANEGVATLAVAPLPEPVRAFLAESGAFQGAQRQPDGRLVDRYAERLAWLRGAAEEA